MMNHCFAESAAKVRAPTDSSLLFASVVVASDLEYAREQLPQITG